MQWIFSNLADSCNHEFNGDVAVEDQRNITMMMLMIVVMIMTVTMTSPMTVAVLITMMD